MDEEHEPLHWVEKFKRAGYACHLIFFSLESVQLAIERVAIRFQNGGHYVRDSEVEQRYSEGFINLNMYFNQFDYLAVLECSSENEKPKTLFSCNEGLKKITNNLPEHFKVNCPI